MPQEVDRTGRQGKADVMAGAWRTLILKGLTDREFKLLDEHGVAYSGSTGPCDPKLYPGVGRYVASFMWQFVEAMQALGWKRIKVGFKGGQVTCQRLPDKRRRVRAA